MTKRSALATAVAALLPCAAFAAVEFTVSDLGVIGAGRYTNGLGINDSGEATGIALTTDNRFHTAFLGQANSVPVALDTLLGGSFSQGQDINNLHQVTGLAYRQGDNNYHAFVWQAGSAVHDLGTLEVSASVGESQGLSINERGQVAGVSSVANGTAEHAAVWTLVNGVWVAEDLGTLAIDGSGDSRANTINSLGDAAGSSTIPGSRTSHATVWTKSAGKWSVKELGTLQGSYSSISGINDSGLATGTASTLNDLQIHAFVADSNATPSVLTDLKTLGGSYSEARAINVSGEVVGFSSGPGELTRLAFIWKNASTGMQDLNSLIDTATGWQLQEANAISDSGFITGVGMLNGEKHAFLLTRITDTTPPVVRAILNPTAPGARGWYLTAPSLAWSVTDAESAISSRVGCTNLAAIGETVGQTFNCTATSAGGTTGPVSTPLIKVDTTAPTITPPANANATLKGSTSTAVSFTAPSAADAISGVNLTSSSCSPASGSLFTRGITPVTCNVSDNAGNLATAAFTVTVTDPTAPAVTPVITGPAGNNGWYRGPVTLSWTVAEPESPETLVTTGCAGLTQATDSAGVSDSCAATSAGGSTPAVSRTIRIDATAPVVTAPAAMVAEAIGSTGATVGWTAPVVSEALSGMTAAGVSCAPASGSAFALGSHTVSCSATDNAGNTGSATFALTVRDTTPPTLSLPAAASASTADAAGTVVTFAASATDTVSGSLAPSCLPASGSIFPVGVTTVGCSATDGAGNTVSGSFDVTVTQTAPPPADITPPTLSLPADISVTAPDGVGIAVSYSATALDNVDGAVSPICNPASASRFLVGTTTVGCTATDAAGNSASGSFRVTVTAPVPPPPSETVGVSLAQCKVISATAGEWLVQGSSSIVTNNAIQLYATATVPADLAAGKLGPAATVNAKGQWQFLAKPGPACTSPISLRTSASGTTRGNISVARK
jgi:probable HAF family extracellular repeat protein